MNLLYNLILTISSPVKFEKLTDIQAFSCMPANVHVILYTLLVIFRKDVFMNIEHLKYLVSVAEWQSISNASRHLHLKQQYLSSIVKNMETHFGTPLFDRHARGITLTADGEYIVNKAREIIKLANEMETSFFYPSQQNISTITDSVNIYSIAQLNSKNLLDAIQLFNSFFPNVLVAIHTNSLQQIINAVAQNEKSLGLAIVFESLEKFKQSLPDTVEIVSITDVSVSVLAASANPVAQSYDTMSISELLNQKLIAYAPYGTVSDSFLYQLLHPYGELNIRYTIDNSAMLISLLQKDNFYSIGHSSIAQNNALIAIPLKEHIPVYKLVLTHKSAIKSTMMKCFANSLLVQE